MFDYFDDEALQIIDNANNKAKLLGLDIIGSESLLLAFLDESLLGSLDLKRNEIIEKINKLIIIRRNEEKSSLYTNKVKDIFMIACDVALDEKEYIVKREHLLYALCATKNCICFDVLNYFKFDIPKLLEEILDLFVIKENIHLVNLTLKAKNEKISKLIGREKEVEKIIRILSKKQKNNPLLIGHEGVGKSKIVEGVVLKCLKEEVDITFYQLDVSVLMSGTKYRGDLEERIMKIIEDIDAENSILFIDEIHNIIGSGNGEGNLDIANILKPILSRNDIKIIGATTVDEYYKYFEKDKALARRFQNVFINEATKEDTKKILLGIKKDFSLFHKVSYSTSVIDDIIGLSDVITSKRLPDKAIDIIDECGVLCHQNKRFKVSKNDVLKVVFDMINIDYNKAIYNLQNKLQYPSIKNEYLSFLNNKKRKYIINVKCNEEEKEKILEDIKNIFELKKEVFLSLDFTKHQETASISSLIGTNPGYIGFDQGGILTEHIIKYPVCVIIISNIEKTNDVIKRLFKVIDEEGFIIDNKGREIKFQNSFIIYVNNQTRQHLGFI